MNETYINNPKTVEIEFTQMTTEKFEKTALPCIDVPSTQIIPTSIPGKPNLFDGRVRYIEFI